MSTDARAEAIRVKPGQLDEIARQVHGKDYRLLSDEEARQVWDLIEKTHHQD